jgi:hypothetical protein
MPGETLGADGAAVETLLRARQLQEFVARGKFGADEVDLEVEAPKKGVKHTAWILMRDCVCVSAGSGPIRFPKGARIENLGVKHMLESAGAKLKATV